MRHRIEDNELLVSLAAAGVGAALLPRLAVDPQRPDVVVVELAVELPSRSALLVRHGDREPTEAVRVVTETIQRIGGELGERLGDPPAAA